MTIRVRPDDYFQTSATPLQLATLDTFDNANGMTMAIDGRTELIIQNQTVGALTVTIASVAIEGSRTGDITAYSVAAGHFCFFQEFPQVGWNSGGNNLMNVDASGALRYAAIQRAAGK